MTGRRQVLLTVSGTIDPDLATTVASGRRPRPDYVEMAETFGADLLDHAEARRTSGVIARLLGGLAGDDVLLAWACFRRRKQYRAVFTDGEQVGIPFAALCWLIRRRPRHVMIGHLLTTRSKELVHRALRLQRHIDVVVVYASPQRRFAIDRLGYPAERVVLSSFMVDTGFWDPATVDAPRRERRMICSVGLELRDYPTLVEAVRGLDVDVVIAAASPWSKRTSSTAGVEIPPNVEVRGFDQFELRGLYAGAAFVVVPLEETDFQAGITTILEAMSMERAVVCSRTAGQTDTVIEGTTGVYVPPGDVGALRAVITALLDDPGTAARLGAAGRQWVREHADVVAYAHRLVATLDS